MEPTRVDERVDTTRDNSIKTKLLSCKESLFVCVNTGNFEFALTSTMIQMHRVAGSHKCYLHIF